MVSARAAPTSLGVEDTRFNSRRASIYPAAIPPNTGSSKSDFGGTFELLSCGERASETHTAVAVNRNAIKSESSLETHLNPNPDLAESSPSSEVAW